MVAYSFQKRFVEPIRSGRKRQTIRADRKRHARPGEVLQLYSGMRTNAIATCRISAASVAWNSIDELVAEIIAGTLPLWAHDAKG